MLPGAYPAPPAQAPSGRRTNCSRSKKHCQTGTWVTASPAQAAAAFPSAPVATPAAAAVAVAAAATAAAVGTSIVIWRRSWLGRTHPGSVTCVVRQWQTTRQHCGAGMCAVHQQWCRGTSAVYHTYKTYILTISHTLGLPAYKHSCAVLHNDPRRPDNGCPRQVCMPASVSMGFLQLDPAGPCAP